MSIDQVEALFDKALNLVSKASQQLPSECISVTLFETVFTNLVNCEHEREIAARENHIGRNV